MIHQGDRLRLLLKEKKVKQAEFASKMQWSGVSYIHQYLAKQVFSDEQLDKISKILGEDVRDKLNKPFGEGEKSTVSNDFKNTVHIQGDPKDEIILYQKELIESLKGERYANKEMIMMLKEQVRALQEAQKENIPEQLKNVPKILQNMHKQSELMMQDIGEIKGKLKLVKA